MRFNPAQNLNAEFDGISDNFKAVFKLLSAILREIKFFAK